MHYRLIAVTCAAACLSIAETDPFPRKEFDQRIADYMKVRAAAIKGLPAQKKKTEPEDIQARKVAMAGAIRAARLEAKQGDVLGPPVQEALIKAVRSETKGKQGLSARKTVQEGNPAQEGIPVALKVNGAYPDNAPLSTVPPTLLLRLPKLPKELEFRFVGKALILRDTVAAIIVDYVPNVLV